MLLHVDDVLTGDDSVDVTAPWIAAIGDFRNSSEGFEKFIVGCSGVILSSNMVMSEAHCFDNGVVIHPEFVRVGVTRIDQTRAQDRRIKEVKFHPDRNPPTWYFDLALIILEEKLIFEPARKRRRRQVGVPQRRLQRPSKASY